MMVLLGDFRTLNVRRFLYPFSLFLKKIMGELFWKCKLISQIEKKTVHKRKVERTTTPKRTHHDKTKVGWTGWSDWFSHRSKVDPSGGLDNARELGRILKRRKVEKQWEKWIQVIMRNKILCPTPVSSEPFFFFFTFPFALLIRLHLFLSIHKLNRAPFISTATQMEHENLLREKWKRKKKEREREDKVAGDRSGTEGEAWKKWWWKRKQIRRSENHHTDWKLCVCVCVCVDVCLLEATGLPITLSLCEVKLLWLQASEDGCSQEEQLVTGDWDKGFCSHERHTNKAQSGYWGSGFWGEPWQEAKKKQGKTTSLVQHLWGKIEEQVCVFQDTASHPYSWEKMRKPRIKAPFHCRRVERCHEREKLKRTVKGRTCTGWYSTVQLKNCRGEAEWADGEGKQWIC